MKEKEEKKLLTGNEAIARGAYEAGVRVATAYPGTPSTEILENISKYPEIYSQWSVNEKVALEVASGSSIAGARTLAAMKHVGLNVAADPFMTMSYTGVTGGLVLISADDPQLHSSQNEQDNRFYARFARVPMLEPSDSQEAKDFVGRALEISERFDTPVILRTTTRISHSRSPVSISDREIIPLKKYEKNCQKYVMIPAYGRTRHRVVLERWKKLIGFS
ncbi:MAG TPA: indolepyruvate ferredoxin oxidoreductase subunit alpha, partial [Actinobacteria bacterium]|nr:indolepyruvate ferredoxin oxidoreductase subunit alpha [Actinomycetota bacterium]